MTTELITYLKEFVTEERFENFQSIIHSRTKHISFVLEEIFQSHNASAVLRSCDCFGIQDLHVIESRNKYSPDRDTAMGAGKWVSIHKHNDAENTTLSCLNFLKKSGRKIVATTPHKDGYDLSNLPIDQPLAIVFGTEKQGISETVMNEADYFVKIPMYGFTESLNISVAAAITAQNLHQRLINSNINWELSDSEKNEILVEWLSSSIKNSHLLIDKFHQINITKNLA